MLTTGNSFLSTSSRGPAAASADDVHRPQTGGQHQTGEMQEHTHTQSHSQRNTHRHTDTQTQTQKCSHTHTGTCSHTHTQTVFNPTETCSHTHGPNVCPPPPALGVCRRCVWRAATPRSPATWWWSPPTGGRTRRRASCWAWTSPPPIGQCHGDAQQ
jgi:hypothetical protein